MRAVRASLSLLATVLAILFVDSVASANRPAAADCLGPDSLPRIDIGRVGALRLNQTLAQLHRLCPNIRDTNATGAETLDTAIVISRPGLSVVGRVWLISGGDEDKPYRVDSSRTIYRWIVTGTNGLLPGGVPLSAPWDSLVRAYGRPDADPLNGDVLVHFCDRLPLFRFHFRDRLYFQEPFVATRDSYPSSLAGARIGNVEILSRQPPPGAFDACRYLAESRARTRKP